MYGVPLLRSPERTAPSSHMDVSGRSARITVCEVAALAVVVGPGGGATGALRPPWAWVGPSDRYGVSVPDWSIWIAPSSRRAPSHGPGDVDEGRVCNRPCRPAGRSHPARRPGDDAPFAYAVPGWRPGGGSRGCAQPRRSGSACAHEQAHWARKPHFHQFARPVATPSTLPLPSPAG